MEDIQADMILPPLTRDVILLEMDPWQAITYNVMQSVLAINAIDSERTDRDYFFHSANRDLLNVTVANLKQSCFWRVEDVAYSKERLAEMVKTSTATLTKERETPLSEEDRELAAQAKNAQ